MGKEYGEMIDKIRSDTVFSIVLKKGGSTHNIVVKEKGEQNLIGNVAIERIIYMYDKKGQPKCEFGFCENVQEMERNKSINVIEATRVFVSPPRIVVIPYDNIGLAEEGPFPYLESNDAIGIDIKLDDNLILEKFPSFRPYHSKEIGGFYQSPVLVKSSTAKFPFKVLKGGPVETEGKEVEGEKEKKE